MTKTRVLIIGGVAGGASAAARLRRLSENAEIIMFEKGEHISFANCGLPYHIGGEIAEESALLLQTPERFRKRFNVDVRAKHEVLGINRYSKTITVKNLVTQDTYNESYDKLIISTGAEPIRPNTPGFNSGKIFTLRNIPDTLRIKEYIESRSPETAVVLGSGYIGLEMAENLHRKGIEVTIVQRSDHVLPPLDFDMACQVHKHIESQGVRLLLSNELKYVREKDDKLQLSLNDTEIETDMMILSIGVKPDSNLAKFAGLEVDARGAIVVDDTLQTSDPDVFAIGDAISVTDFVSGRSAYIPLAGPANKQGRIVAERICGYDSLYAGTQGSSIIRVFDMTVASTGLNERSARGAGIDYEKSYTFSPDHAGYFPGALDMSIKTVFEKKTGKMLGAQIVGFEGVDKRCDVIATAIRAKMTVRDMVALELCYAPQYSSAKDPVNIAAYVAENVIDGKVRLFHWHDVIDLPRDGSVQLVDVRTNLEYENGHIEGFKNIPLDEIRERLGELDKEKKTYVTCQVGVRGYNAARILMQSEFENVFNLSGGYRLWSSIFNRSVPPVSVPKTGKKRPETKDTSSSSTGKTIKINACGLQCPGPIMKLSSAIEQAVPGEVIEITVTDPAFAGDIEGFSRRTGHQLLDISCEKGKTTAMIRKNTASKGSGVQSDEKNGKNFIVFSGELDKAIAAFIMANAAAALGRKVSMFFTFWGLNVIKKSGYVQKPGQENQDFMMKMFKFLMPKSSHGLPLSKMNFFGAGPKMIRSMMDKKHVDSLESLIRSAQQNGVELVACSMSMELMGIRAEELLDGVKLGGAAAMLAHAEESDMSLFI